MSLMRPLSSIHNELNRLFYEMEDMLVPGWTRRTGEKEAGGNLMSVWAPPMDINETENDVIVKASVPGMKPEEIDIEVEHNILTLRGETTHEEEAHEKNYHRREIAYGKFFRQVQLPTEVDGDKAQASFQDGMLNITIPKSKQIQRHKIKVDRS